MATIIEKKKRRIDEVDAGTVVLIEELRNSDGTELDETTSILNKLYMVADESTVVEENNIDFLIVYVINLKSGYLYKLRADTLVTEVDCKIIADI